MMKPLYDRNVTLVAWIDSKGNIFSHNLAWIAFVKNDNVFDLQCNWLGGTVYGTLVDRGGKPVAWSPDVQPRSTYTLTTPVTPIMPVRPVTPMTPVTPITPMTPITPIGGWSHLNWMEFIGGQ